MGIYERILELIGSALETVYDSLIRPLVDFVWNKLVDILLGNGYFTQADTLPLLIVLSMAIAASYVFKQRYYS